MTAVRVFPPAAPAWRSVAPEQAGLDAGRLADVAAFAAANETDWRRDIAAQLAAGTFEPPPWNEILGPTKERGGPAGVILRHGQLVAEWGDAARPDMTFSVAKSYLAVLAGIAVADGLLPDPDARVADSIDDEGFASPHNRQITWTHLLQQASEWEGTLWDKPDLVDRNRQLGPGADNSRKGQHRDLQRPGSYWEYNDVRVNRLSLALLRLFRRPLPDILRERVMRPIGASEDWEWHGYRNSTVTIDGREMVSVPGGSHWGGGLWISARDQARLGVLMLNGGRWQAQQILPEAWVERMLVPCPLNPGYGYMWWLNTGRQRYPAASARAFTAIGAGGNTVFCDPEADVVLVARWTADAAVPELIRLLLSAITG